MPWEAKIPLHPCLNTGQILVQGAKMRKHRIARVSAFVCVWTGPCCRATCTTEHMLQTYVNPIPS